jgi:DNA polymerase III alpha subunit
VQVAGIISRIKKRQTKNKDNWAQLTLEDESQSITANAFSRVWLEIGNKIEINQAVIVSGEIRGDELSAKPEITINSVEPILNAVSRKAKRLVIDLPANTTQEQLMRLNSLLGAARGVCEVYFRVEEKDGQKTCIRTPKQINIHTALIAFIEESFGREAWDFD